MSSCSENSLMAVFSFGAVACFIAFRICMKSLNFGFVSKIELISLIS